MSDLSDADREALAEAVYRELGDMVNRDYLIDALSPVVAQIRDAAVKAALTQTADAWQWGEWANAPRRADRVEERIANAQFVTDWLRNRAALESL
jgi:hypothetical protein